MRNGPVGFLRISGVAAAATATPAAAPSASVVPGPLGVVRPVVLSHPSDRNLKAVLVGAFAAGVPEVHLRSIQ